MVIPQYLPPYLSQIRRMSSDSHKGQNGKVLLIGGSDLFHSASRWALDVVSSMVDMVFYSSVLENNELIAEAKKNFWDGVVIPRREVEAYLQEADVVLIGPGMTRDASILPQIDSWRDLLLSGCEWSTRRDPRNPQVPIRFRAPIKPLSSATLHCLEKDVNWEVDTYAIVNYLLAKYPDKKWVIDAGALQMVEPALLTSSVILTPHFKELKMVFTHLERWVAEHDEKTDVEVGHTIYPGGYQQFFDGVLSDTHSGSLEPYEVEEAMEMSADVGGATILLKGHSDQVCTEKAVEIISGGNPGMTKGGTGDALAGLLAGLYCFTPNPLAAAVVGSFVNKQAGDALFSLDGPFFKTSELVQEIPKVLKELLYS